MVLMVLALRANHKRGDLLAWPSAGSIAKDCRASRSSVSEALASLRESGDIIDTGTLKDRKVVYLIEAARSVPDDDTTQDHNDDYLDDVVSPLRTDSVPAQDTTKPGENRNVLSGDSVMSSLGTDSVLSGDTNRKEPEEEPEKEEGGTAHAAPPVLDLSLPESAKVFIPPEDDPYAKFFPKCDFDAPMDVMEAAKTYNQMIAWLMERNPDAPRIPVRCGKMTPELAKAMKPTIKACGGIEGWRAQLRKVAQSKFFNGTQHLKNGHETWRLKLSYLTEKRNGKPTINQFIEAEEDVPQTAEQYAVATGQIDAQTARILKRLGGSPEAE